MIYEEMRDVDTIHEYGARASSHRTYLLHRNCSQKERHDFLMLAKMANDHAALITSTLLTLCRPANLLSYLRLEHIT